MDWQSKAQYVSVERTQFPVRRGTRGLTLLEVVVVLVGLAIALAVAIPYWQSHRIRLHRMDARTELLSTAERLAGCHERLNAYHNSACTVILPVITPAGTYRLSGEILADSFRLTAQPLGEQEADKECGSYFLDDQGHRGVSGSLAPGACWQAPE